MHNKQDKSAFKQFPKQVSKKEFKIKQLLLTNNLFIAVSSEAIPFSYMKFV